MIMRIIAVFFWLLFYAGAATGVSQAMSSSVQTADIEVFVREGCPHCDDAKKFLSLLQLEQPHLRIEIRDVLKEPAALERLKRISESQGMTSVSVPAFSVNGRLIVGFSDEASTGRLIRESLARASPQNSAAFASCEAEQTLSCAAEEHIPDARQETFEVNFFGHDISLDRVGLPLFTLALGLLDGFNPCSMWVLILMISLLAPLHNRPRMLAIAGTFVLVEGIAYFLFIAAWLNLFLFIGYSRASEIIIATLALIAGAINLKDSWNPGWGVSLSIPAAAKPGIYSRMRRILHADNIGAALLCTVVLAILVQIVEFMCTSGFPALFTRILTLRQMDSMSYYGYLLLYDLAYMLDDAIVLTIGVITLSQRRLQEKEGRWLKLVSGLVMAGLGIYLLLATH